jgi:uracil-DNA glycosylase
MQEQIQNMPISSRALGKIREGSETRDTKVSPKHPPLVIKTSDDIVRSSWKHETNVIQPYPQPYVADGIAFSCSNIGKPEASLRYIFKALEETVYPEGYLWDPDLARWSNQGVLMLNSALTTQINKTGTHYALWESFLIFLFDYLNVNHPGLVYVFLGKKAQEWADTIADNNFKLFCSHPASAAYQNLERWDCNDVFNKTNEILSNQNNEKIIW